MIQSNLLERMRSGCASWRHIIRGHSGTMIPGFERSIYLLNLGQPATWVNGNSCRRLQRTLKSLLPPAKREFESGESDTAERVQIDCAVDESAERSHCQHYLTDADNVSETKPVVQNLDCIRGTIPELVSFWKRELAHQQSL